MNFPERKTLTKNALVHLMVFAVCITALTFSTLAQKSAILAGAAADLDHCENGPLATPEICRNSGSTNNWGNGQLGASKAHYREGESVPNRVVFTDLVIGREYYLTVAYDVTKGGKYAYDYLTSYDRTENGSFPSAGQADPCSDVIPLCNPLAPTATADITDDPLVNAPNGPGQIAGQTIDFWGASSASFAYTAFTGTQADTSTRFVTFTFRASATTAVVAWGGHISTRENWGDNNSAIAITGSPYHFFLDHFADEVTPDLGVGEQHHQISVDAIYFPAAITIEKLVANAPSYTSAVSFPFSITPNNVTTPAAGFSLVDSNPSPILGGVQQLETVTFGSNIVVTENIPQGWSLESITCTVDGGGNLPGTAVANVGAGTATFNLNEGNRATCTFTNSQLGPSAAPASAGGRVVDSFGRGISGARMTVQNAATGETYVTYTSPFGYYNFVDLEAPNFYFLSISSKKYQFSNNTITFSLDDNLTNLDFVANP